MTPAACLTTVALSLFLCAPTCAQAVDQAPSLGALGTGPGLALTLPLTDGALEARLAAAGRLVHALAIGTSGGRGSASPGLVSVQPLPDAKALPFAVRSLDLVVADLDALGAAAPAKDEILRVLVPQGTAVVRQGGAWTTWTASADPRLDDWTHRWYDASNNPVSKDRVAGPPTSIRWLSGLQSFGGARPWAGPRFAAGLMSYEWYLGPTEEHFLAARGAFNGLLRWQQPSSAIAGGTILRSHPRRPYLQMGTVIYTYPKVDGRLTAIDAATGAVLRTYDQGAAVARDIPEKDAKTPDPYGSLYLLHHAGTLIETYGPTVRALDAASGALRWSWTATDGLLVGSPCVAAEAGVVAVLVRDASVKPYRIAIPDRHPEFWASGLAGLDLASGAQRWRVARKNEAIGQVVSDGAIFVWHEHGILSGPYDRKQISTGAVDAVSGRELWTVAAKSGSGMRPSSVLYLRAGKAWLSRPCCSTTA